VNDPASVAVAPNAAADPPARVAIRYYIIATAPRTGSSLLTEALAATRQAGSPDEYFDVHPNNELNWVNRFRIPRGAGYIEHLEAATRTPNGVFGFKLHWHQMPALSNRLLEARPDVLAGRPVFDLLQERFPDVRFIWLTRRNKIAQAISYYRAAETNVWRVWSDNRPAVTAAGRQPEYSRAGIERHLRMVNNMDAGWRRFFREHGITTLAVIYEDFVRSYERTVRQALTFLGLPADGLVVPPPALRRLADTESAEWERRFREEMALARAPAAVETMIAVPAVARNETTAAAEQATVRNENTALAEQATAASAMVRNEIAAAAEPVIVRNESVVSAEQATAASAVVRNEIAAPVARPKATAVSKPKPGPETLPLIAYDVGSPMKTNLVPGQPTRAWMNATPQRFAYRCLPMVIANQWGWMIETQHRVEAIWDGSQPPAGLVVTSDGDEKSNAASSHFGSGVLTFNIGFLFRTPPGFNIHVRGPANWPKDGACPLEGIVETDWVESTFTMNWKLTRPNHPVVFEAGEPIAMISPVRRGQLEQFSAEIQPLSQNHETFENYTAWSKSRDRFNADLKVTGSAAKQARWQKDYTRGRTVTGEAAPEHQTALELKDFTARR